MILPPSWTHALEMRWFTRRAKARGLPEYSGSLCDVVVPPDKEGRPGYRLKAVGPSVITREPSVGGSTSDFLLKYAPHSHLIGICTGRSAAGADPLTRAIAAMNHPLAGHPNVATSRCIAPPTPMNLAGEPGYFWTVELTTGRGNRMVVTDRLFDHAGWSFTVGTMHHPLDPPAELQTAWAILDSWTWLSDDAEA